MNVCKLLIAIALFVSSVNIEQQVFTTKSGMDVSWKATISVSQSFAQTSRETEFAQQY